MSRQWLTCPQSQVGPVGSVVAGAGVELLVARTHSGLNTRSSTAMSPWPGVPTLPLQ